MLKKTVQKGISKSKLLKNILSNVLSPKEFDKQARTKKPIVIDCLACGLCEKVCTTESIKIFKFKDIICENCGACANVCPVDAINLNRFDIDSEKCIQCGYCALFCTIPIIMNEIPIINTPHITNECNNCGLCVPKCPEKAISYDKSLSKIVISDNCRYSKNNNLEINEKNKLNDECMICKNYCPMNAIILPKDYNKACIIKLDINSCIFCKDCQYICPLNEKGIEFNE
ncbi:4Fe-4S binding protein [Methanococcus voltae]|uniref:4Fe-4S ferredoxin iron-sulfur binding domain protein n=1 Tax=Methanococcus voltae (strain ATCC BAA-1334 / A3) TaxID=456320 RepID=D7DUS0_METV3|nr:4Fe-4S binding protein [Methanococcus voltae]MCS3900682.1 ferredoxin [Methanococcus voltae]